MPEKINKGSHRTSTVTILEYLNAKNNPSEYVRIMADLSSKEGTVRLLNGDIIRRAKYVLEKDTSQRCEGDRIYQASLMEYGNKERYYSNRIDDHLMAAGEIKKLLHNVETGEVILEVVKNHIKKHRTITPEIAKIEGRINFPGSL